MLLKKHCPSMELIPHDVVEHILERLPAKSLLRFKSVSRKWKSTIESRYFRERQLIHRRDPDVLLVYMSCDDVAAGPNIQVLESSSPLTRVKIHTENTIVSQSSCDGLVCTYSPYKSGVVANPTTRWSRSFPHSRFQQMIINLQEKFFELAYPFPLLGFGKDSFQGTYKPVLLYNSSELGLENVTTCEVFDFSANVWRYVTPASPYRILAYPEPLYLDGSLHWFTEGEETKVLSFHLHTETFQVISKAPFVDHVVKPKDMIMYSLHNRLCVSEKKQLEQVIWSFDSGNKTWAKLYSIDLNITSSWFGMQRWALSVLPVPGTNKLLLFDREYHEHKQRLVLHDPQTNSYDLLLTAKSIGLPLCYFQSLISIS